MPLLTARDFPGINAAPDQSGLAQGVFTALQGVGQMQAKKQAEQKAELATQLDIAAAHALQIRNMPDGGDDPNKRQTAYIKKRKALTSLMLDRHAQGLDNSLFDKVFDEKNPDMFNTLLTSIATRSQKGRDLMIEQGVTQDEPFTSIGKARADLEAGLITQEDFNKISSPVAKYKFVKEYSIGNGQFQSAWVPEVPGTGAIITTGEPFEKTSLVTVNTGEKLPPNFRWIDPDDKSKGIEPIPGSKGGQLSGESAKLAEISRAGASAVGDLREMLASGKMTNETLLQASAPDFLNYFMSADVQEFKLLRSDLTDMIGRLRSGGAINKEEQANFIGFLPKHGDKKEVKEKKLGRLADAFENIAANVNLAPLEEERIEMEREINGILYQKIEGKWYAVE